MLRTFLRVVQGWYRKRGREQGLVECRGGSVTFAQRFGSALNLNPHLHTLALDGVFSRANVFHSAPPLPRRELRESKPTHPFRYKSLRKDKTMLIKTLHECEALLRARGFDFPTFNIQPWCHPLSWTDANGNICIGLTVRAINALTGTSLRHPVLHEMMHSLFRRSSVRSRKRWIGRSRKRQFLCEN